MIYLFDWLLDKSCSIQNHFSIENFINFTKIAQHTTTTLSNSEFELDVQVYEANYVIGKVKQLLNLFSKSIFNK